MTINVLTPVGRLVQGSAFDAYTKDIEGNPLKNKEGLPRVRYFMALAVPKTDPKINDFLREIVGVARAAFPTLFDAAGNCTHAEFAYKFADGDLTPEKEGFAGCWILKFSGGFAPKCYTRGGEAVITDPQGIKRGYFIRISGTCAGNASARRPGVYLNPQMIEFVGYGEEIIGGADSKEVFGAAPAALPPGASATPFAPQVPLAPAAPAPATTVQPHPGFLYVNNNN